MNKEELHALFVNHVDAMTQGERAMGYAAGDEVDYIPFSIQSNEEAMADLFGVSESVLLGRPENDLVNADPELTEYLQQLRDRPELRMLFSLTKNATKQDVEAAVRIIEALRAPDADT